MVSEKICFLVMAHEHFDQLKRLLKTLQHPAFDSYLHLDKKAGQLDLDPGLVTTVEQPVAYNRGGYSSTLASLELIKCAVGSGEPYRYYTLLSGVDYPIRSNQEIHRFFARSEAEYIHVFGSERSFWHNRYRRFHFMDMHPLPGRLMHRIGYRTQGWLFPYRKIPLGLKPYWGSAWWSLSHEAIRYVLRFLEQNPRFAEFFRYTSISDEMFYQIILNNSPFGARIKANLRYIDWSLGGSHPKLLDGEDFEKFKTGDWLFARKFDMAANGTLLDKIDRELRA